MANFLAVVDPDPARRAEFLRLVAPRLHLLPGLAAGEVGAGDFAAVWAAGSRAPVRLWADGAGCALLFGSALPEGRREELDAVALSALWASPEDAGGLDGLHVGLAYSFEKGLVVGADPLGLLPVYWWSRDGVALVGSSAALFPLHPRFRSAPDAHGLAALLLFSHGLEGRTLQEGVRRLGAGNLLLAPGGREPREAPQYRPRLSEGPCGLDDDAQADLLDQALAEATRRQAPAGRAGLLLSGGRDSRMLAVLLHRQGGGVASLTWGRRGEVQVGCAGAVARALGFEHRVADAPDEAVSRGAELVVRWEGLAAGLNNPLPWGFEGELGRLPERVVAGYVMDPVVGGSHVAWARSAATGEVGFRPFFERINQYGFGPEVLRAALRAGPVRDAVEPCVERARALFEEAGGSPLQRAWLFDLRHRQRFHVGRVTWPLCFGAWPVFPAADRRVLDACGGLPMESLEGRRLQDLLLRTRYPEVARLPVDRNSPKTTPLVRTRAQRVLAELRRPWSRLRRHLGGTPDRDQRRLYYYRVFDVNGAGWSAVRRQAEGGRECLETLFEPERLRTLVPPPDVPVRVGDAITDTYGMKVLLGLMLAAQGSGGPAILHDATRRS